MMGRDFHNPSYIVGLETVELFWQKSVLLARMDCMYFENLGIAFVDVQRHGSHESDERFVLRRVSMNRGLEARIDFQDFHAIEFGVHAPIFDPPCFADNLHRVRGNFRFIHYHHAITLSASSTVSTMQT